MGDAEIPPADNSGIRTLDQLVRRRGEENVQTPIIAYPKSERGLTDYEHFSGRDINRFVDGAVKALIKKGVEPVYHNPVVALYSNSDRDFFITFLALNRLGYGSLMLSPRLAATACLNLLSTLNADMIFHGAQGAAVASECQKSRALKLLSVLKREEYDVPEEELGEYFVREGLDPATEHERHAAFLHSSGSSGIPKPLPYSNKRIISLMQHARDVTHFLTVPIFHGLGIGAFFHCFYMRNTCYVFNGNMPQTHATLTKALKAAQPYYVVTVPYALKLWAEKQEGIDALAEAKIVTAGGSRIIDEVGDLLVEQGVHLGSNFGTTEVGFLFSSTWRPKEDKAWNYLEARPHVAPFIYWKPYAEDLFECVVLDGFSGKAASNSMDPPNSYHTSDLWTPHPTLPNRWKFVGRIDDRVTLANGEKVLPLEIEGRIRKDPFIREAVVFGIDRPVPGLLLTRADVAQNLSGEEFLDRVWPTIQNANRHSEAFAQITREVVIPLPLGTEIPITDKMSVKRAQVYRDFAQVIDNVYTRLDDSLGGDLQLEIPELEQWIMTTFKTSLGVTLDDRETDFFFAGVDSLKAIQMRGLIARTLDLGGNAKNCGAMIVSDCGNTMQLARFLHRLRTGEGDSCTKTATEEMNALIEQFSVVPPHVPGGAPIPERNTVLLTGATGSLGAHILSALSVLPTVSRTYCLIRAPDSDSAASRLHSTLFRYGLPPLPPASSSTVTAIPTDLSAGTLFLPNSITSHLKTHLTHIIHTAWPVNFTLPLSSFTPHLSSLQQLLTLAQSVTTPRPAHVLFASSVGVANAAPPGTVVPEGPLPRFVGEGEEELGCRTQPTGYARSKLVAEKMIEHAVGDWGARATVLRIGQIVPPSSALGSSSNPTVAFASVLAEEKSHGRHERRFLWNPNEMIPLIVRAAAMGFTGGAMPSTLRGGVEACHWLPVDVLAQSILELACIANNTDVDVDGVTADPSQQAQDQGSEQGQVRERVREQEREKQLIYNLVHPIPFSWRSDFLPALRRAAASLSSPASSTTTTSASSSCSFPSSVSFNEEVSWTEWIRRLANSDSDVSRNPSRKLLGFWRGGEGGAAASPSSGERKKQDGGDKEEEGGEEVITETPRPAPAPGGGRGDGEEEEEGNEKSSRGVRVGVLFDTTHARTESAAMRTARPVVVGLPTDAADAADGEQGNGTIKGDAGADKYGYEYEYVRGLLEAWLQVWMEPK